MARSPKTPPAATGCPARGYSDDFRDRLDLARQADATVAVQPGRPIAVRTVPRAAVEALMARLVASGAVERPTEPGRP